MDLMGVDLMGALPRTLVSTARDVAPIVIVLVFFQVLFVRRRPPNLPKVLAGFAYVLVGMALFILGLEQALFPLGETMARQLSAVGAGANWRDYGTVYAFAAAIGFATTIAEPSLIAVSLKARDASGGAVQVLGLRLAVAVGVAIGVALGTFRIVTGTSLATYIIIGYAIVLVQTWTAPRSIVPLAYDSGGVTTSTVTVPVVTALGLGLADAVPGRSPLVDGFGLIAFASVFPIMTVLAYGSLAAWLKDRRGGEEERSP